ncbi:MAG: IPExxxVDY family protein [Crocinitomicaceae bacterium]
MPNFDTVMAKVKKYELILEDEMTLEVIGISSAFADYRLAWKLNQRLNINLIKSNEVFDVRALKSKESLSFRYFSFFDEEYLTRIYLIKNRQEPGMFHSDRPMIDFFLVLRENFSFEKEALIQQLRKINGIVAVFDFPESEFELISYLTS